MVLRAHCDRCNSLIGDKAPGWVEEKSGKIWHININDGRTREEVMLCFACAVSILETYLASLKSDVA